MTKEELKTKSIHELRIYARKVGVARCTTIPKAKLIDEILDVESGVKKASYSKKGRPPINKQVESIIEKKHLTESERAKLELLFINFKRDVFSVLDGGDN